LNTVPHPLAPQVVVPPPSVVVPKKEPSLPWTNPGDELPSLPPVKEYNVVRVPELLIL
jgi:hypothetical protein